ncbi:hypothetical protein BYT27DRAFT_7225460 [Phlegmacium glaucopus]|nr:hypothetical protein BYT27DRAFT_7225460 [Phlegmacium glaucopus]
MPVHFKVASHDAQSVRGPKTNSPTMPEELLGRTWGVKAKTTRCAELLQSSFVNKGSLANVLGRNNGFVDTVTLAYNEHHHLIIRPDDVWIAILGQFNFYVNAHAEELRSHFVQHEGKKELVVKAQGTRYTVDFGALAYQMTNKIHENVVDTDLQKWILPDFTTSTSSDTIICSVLMMSTLKAYFSYTMELACGIPSVTLEGEKSDWERLLARLDKLNSFGEEPKAWAALLRPILTRFVAAFDGEPDIDFWSRVCHYHPQGSGPTYLSGWITAFCVWSSVGKWQGHCTSDSLVLDEVSYPVIKSQDVPMGFCEVDVKLIDNEVTFQCMMVSGHLALSIEGEKKDSIRPLPSWFMFIKEECEDPEQIALRKVMEDIAKMKEEWAKKRSQ